MCSLYLFAIYQGGFGGGGGGGYNRGGGIGSAGGGGFGDRVSLSHSLLPSFNHLLTFSLLSALRVDLVELQEAEEDLEDHLEEGIKDKMVLITVMERELEISVEVTMVMLLNDLVTKGEVDLIILAEITQKKTHPVFVKYTTTLVLVSHC